MTIWLANRAACPNLRGSNGARVSRRAEPLPGTLVVMGCRYLASDVAVLQAEALVERGAMAAFQIGGVRWHCGDSCSRHARVNDALRRCTPELLPGEYKKEESSLAFPRIAYANRRIFLLFHSRR